MFIPGNYLRALILQVVVNPIAKPAKPNQLFYENKDGILLCKLNNLALEMQCKFHITL